MQPVILEEDTLFTRVHAIGNQPAWLAIANLLNMDFGQERKLNFFFQQESFFPRGLTPFVVERLSALGHQVQWTATPRQVRNFNNAPAGELRHWQPWVVSEMLKHRYGTIDVATRFGKSYVYGGWYVNAGRPMTLLLVPTAAIAAQISQELQEWLNEPVGIIASTVQKEHVWQNFTVAIEKSFFDTSGQIKPQHLPYLHAVEARIRDECHIHGDVALNLYSNMPNTIYAWAGSATPSVVDPVKNWSNVAWHGPIRCQVTAHFAAQYGIVAPVIARFVAFQHAQTIGSMPWETRYNNFIVVNERRNALISSLANFEIAKGATGLIFVNHTEQAERIKPNIPGAVIVASKLVTHAEAEQIKHGFNTGEIRCVITTKKWREGVTFKCDFCINAEGMQADHVVVQKLGRGLIPKQDGAALRWYDIFDVGDSSMKAHAENRLQSVQHQGWPHFLYENLEGCLRSFDDPVTHTLCQMEAKSTYGH